MLLDYCLKPQSPCDDGLALDLVLSCDPSPCHLWVQQDASAVCVCVCVLSHLQIHVCASQTYFCLFFFPVLMTWKKCHTAPFIAVVCVTHLIPPNCLLLALQTKHSVIFQCGLGDAGSKIDGCLLLSLQTLLKLHGAYDFYFHSNCDAS